MIERIGKYEILDYIADGGQGTVYKALDPVFKRTYAVKVINQPISRDPAYLLALQMKTGLTTNLYHPGIVGTYDCGREVDTAYIVTDYMPSSLARKLDMGRPMSCRYAVRMAQQVGRAMEYAHGKGVLHGNIKPENILFSRSGTPRVSDFGISKCLGFSKYRGRLHIRGGLFYSSPEQLQGQAVDHRSDIFSLGKVLYESLLGTIPLSQEGILLSPCGQLGLPGFNWEPKQQVPSEVQAVIDKATAPSPGDRYEDIGKMVMDLQKVLRSLPDDLVLRSPSMRRSSHVTRHRSPKGNQGSHGNPPGMEEDWQGRMDIPGDIDN